MYDGIRDVLNNTANDDSVKLVYLTGAGDYFSSGNDLANFTQIPPEGPKKMAAEGRQRLKYVSSEFRITSLIYCIFRSTLTEVLLYHAV